MTSLRREGGASSRYHLPARGAYHLSLITYHSPRWRAANHRPAARRFAHISTGTPEASIAMPTIAPIEPGSRLMA